MYKITFAHSGETHPYCDWCTFSILVDAHHQKDAITPVTPEDGGAYCTECGQWSSEEDHSGDPVLWRVMPSDITCDTFHEALECAGESVESEWSEVQIQGLFRAPPDRTEGCDTLVLAQALCHFNDHDTVLVGFAYDAYHNPNVLSAHKQLMLLLRSIRNGHAYRVGKTLTLHRDV